LENPALKDVAPTLGTFTNASNDKARSELGRAPRSKVETLILAVRRLARLALLASGWPNGAFGGQGTITPIESGYYRISLRRTLDGWKITENHTILDLPPALPET
jgi:hypothetical protein